MVAAVPLVRLFNRHQIKHQYDVFFLENPEDNGITSPDMHSIDLLCGKKAFYIRYTIGIFQPPYMVEDRVTMILRVLFESSDDASLDHYLHSISLPGRFQQLLWKKIIAHRVYSSHPCYSIPGQLQQE
jgi:hypothetical protein